MVDFLIYNGLEGATGCHIRLQVMRMHNVLLLPLSFSRVLSLLVLCIAVSFTTMARRGESLQTHFARIILCKYQLISAFTRRATTSLAVSGEDEIRAKARGAEKKRKKRTNGRKTRSEGHRAGIFSSINVPRVQWQRTNTGEGLHIDMNRKTWRQKVDTQVICKRKESAENFGSEDGITNRVFAIIMYATTRLKLW